MFTAINDDIHIVTVGEQGPPGSQGTDGTPGLSGDGAVNVNFFWNDVPHKYLMSIPADKVILKVGVYITEDFDGVSPSLQIGDSTADRFMKSTDSDPKTIGEYSVSPAYVYSVPTDLYLSIVPGAGCDRGKGIVRVHLQQ